MTSERRDNVPAGRPVSAVFFIYPCNWIGPALAGWLAAGNHVAAIVFTEAGHRRYGIGSMITWLDRHISVFRHARRHEIPLIGIAAPLDWQAVAERLSTLQADVLISIAFPVRIPAAVLDMFPHGGLNLHPAFLPHHRGPHPIQHTLLEGSWQRQSGVTLHRMSAAFDAGDIVAQVRFEPDDWRSRHALDEAIAGGVGTLVVEAVPAFVHGCIGAMPQPAGTFAWASRVRQCMVLRHDWSQTHAAAVLRLYAAPRPGVALIADGVPVRLGGHLARLGPPTGGPPDIGRLHATFDLSDARVRCRRHIGILARLVTFWCRLQSLRIKARPLKIDYPDPR